MMFSNSEFFRYAFNSIVVMSNAGGSAKKLMALVELNSANVSAFFHGDYVFVIDSITRQHATCANRFNIDNNIHYKPVIDANSA